MTSLAQRTCTAVNLQSAESLRRELRDAFDQVSNRVVCHPLLKHALRFKPKGVVEGVWRVPELNPYAVSNLIVAGYLVMCYLVYMMTLPL